MAQTNQSRPVEGRLRCDCFPATRASAYSLEDHRLQHLITRHGIASELACILAAHAFGDAA